MTRETRPTGDVNDAVVLRQTGPLGRLLLAVPRGVDVEEATDRGEWLTGHGVEVEP